MRRTLLIVAVACCALATACGGADSTGQRGADGSGSGASGAAPDQASASVAALDFTVPAVDGGTFRGADYAGKALAIWFWAPW